MKKLISLLLVLTTLAMLTAIFSVNTMAAWDGKKTDLAWYNTTDTEFTLTTGAQLAGLAAIVNGKATGIAADNFAGKTILLGDDIDLGGFNWTPIATNVGASSATGFMGIFDGQQHSISNLAYYLDADRKTIDGAYIGLFGLLGGTAKNINFVSATVVNTAPLNAGIAAGRVLSGGVLSQCSIDADSVYESGTNTNGMFVGRLMGGGTIEYCINYGTLYAYGISTQNIIAGGITGLSESGSFIKNCVNYGDVYGEIEDNNPGQVGLAGIVAFASKTVIENCVNYGNITITDVTLNTKSGVGGIVGKFHAADTTVTNCYNFGSVTGKDGDTVRTGLILGFAQRAGELEDCYSTPSGNLDVAGSGNPENITANNTGVVSEKDAGYAAIKTEVQTIESTINQVDVPRKTDGFGYPIINLKEIATPTVSFGDEESHPRFLSDNANTRWSANGYTGTEEPWVQYEFPCRLSVTGCVIKWYNDGSGSKKPEELDIQYWNGEEFLSVIGAYDEFLNNVYLFNTVETTILRIVMTPVGTLGGDGSGMPAIAEWSIIGKLAEGAVVPKPEILSIASIAKPSATFASKTDFVFNLNDNTDARWSANGYTGIDKPWVQYTLPLKVSADSCIIKWYDDGSGTRVPKAIDIQYWDGTEFLPVEKIGVYTYIPNQDNIYKFKNIDTNILRIIITPAGQLGGDGKGMPGIVEWNVMGYVFMEYTENDMMNAYIAAAGKEPDTGDATIYVTIAMAVSFISLAALVVSKRRSRVK
ncbi:MAG: hypothetical protein ACOX31_07665 [Eubacteriales bacterium]|jgi:hypothetical protein